MEAHKDHDRARQQSTSIGRANTYEDEDDGVLNRQALDRSYYDAGHASDTKPLLVGSASKANGDDDVNVNVAHLQEAPKKKRGWKCCCCRCTRCRCFVSTLITLILLAGFGVIFLVYIYPLLNTLDPVQRISQSPPDACEAPRVLNVTSSSIALDWDPPESKDATILKFSVQWRHFSDTDWSTDPISVINPPCSVTDLLGNTSYCFRISAVSSIGPGEYGNVTCMDTEEATEPTVPSGLVPIDTSDTSLEFTWTAAEANGSPIEYYEVDVSEQSSQQNSYNAEWTTGCRLNVMGKVQSSYRCTVKELKGATTYKIRINAVNAVGASSWYSPADTYHTDKPDAKVPGEATVADNVDTGPDYINLNWTIADDGGSMILSYTIEMEGKFIRNSSDPYTKISGLLGSTQYCFRVRGTNNIGNGPWSKDLACFNTTDPRTPDAPTMDPVPVDTSPLSLTVSWIKSQARGSNITGYTVQRDDWWLDKGLTNDYIGGPNNFSYVASTNMMPASTYNFRVQAMSDHGTSPWSGVINYTTNNNGNCGNAYDVVVYYNTKTTMKKNIQGCLIKCAVSSSKQDCVVKCIGEDVGLSPQCSDCWYENGECILNKCMVPCLAPNSDNCQNCAKDECFPQTVECSGIPQYFFPE